MIEKINAAIDAALVENGAMQAPRNYLGGSRLGDPCARKLRYEWDDLQANIRNPGAVKPPFNGRAYRRFAMGHMHEELTIKWFRQAGFDLRNHNDDGSQYSFGEEDAPIAGHIDGVILSGPVELPYPVLWEHKVTSSKQWKEFVSKGVEGWKPVYYGQLQVYLRWTSLSYALFTALNTDTSELHFELVPYKAEVAEALLARGKEVIRAHDASALPRITMDPADFKCRWCDHKARCWSVATPAPVSKPVTAKPVWSRT